MDNRRESATGEADNPDMVGIDWDRQSAKGMSARGVSKRPKDLVLFLKSFERKCSGGAGITSGGGISIGTPRLMLFLKSVVLNFNGS